MSHREGALSCPGCGELLAPKQVGEAILDACPGCGGVWVDWFDGELADMVRGAPAEALAAGAPGTGRGECPRCHTALREERYLETKAAIDRCGECAGAFVRRDAASALRGVEPKAAEDAWGRLAAVLRGWFGWDEEQA